MITRSRFDKMYSLLFRSGKQLELFVAEDHNGLLSVQQLVHRVSLINHSPVHLVIGMTAESASPELANDESVYFLDVEKSRHPRSFQFDFNTVTDTSAEPRFSTVVFDYSVFHLAMNRKPLLRLLAQMLIGGGELIIPDFDTTPGGLTRGKMSDKQKARLKEENTQSVLADLDFSIRTRVPMETSLFRKFLIFESTNRVFRQVADRFKTAHKSVSVNSYVAVVTRWTGVSFFTMIEQLNQCNHKRLFIQFSRNAADQIQDLACVLSSQPAKDSIHFSLNDLEILPSSVVGTSQQLFDEIVLDTTVVENLTISAGSVAINLLHNLLKPRGRLIAPKINHTINLFVEQFFNGKVQTYLSKDDVHSNLFKRVSVNFPVSVTLVATK